MVDAEFFKYPSLSGDSLCIYCTYIFSFCLMGNLSANQGS
ncbi:hypothetical protein QN277_022637 [Acacia crassicarpa]|uniref:Uncharacterized protein n=1 Tax=Acacia crassicarpa TaxID=499986 RepID=A0AAE1ML67_9FABA|nr:hypothetical protein QN277_022637 [Acacia crassicarpa]